MSPAQPGQSFDSVLVANRGEIACRIIRSIKALGLRSVAVYSEADAGAPHVVAADEAVCIGAAPAAESYLDVARVLEAVANAGAQAVHPGYGFLAENADFAAACEDAGVVFVGPPPAAIASMGNKAEAKRRMEAAGVPCVPGYDGTDPSDEAFAAAAASIGFPLMVKAASGGGGRGMRRVGDGKELAAALPLARSEARSAFGSDELILERLIEDARHVEIQVFADAYGNTIHLGERDCSIQRRHQKVIEEAPSPAVDPTLRDAMGAAAVAAANAIGYRGAGTVEFLLDHEGQFYFLEMNTRLQVEHPVTELITGVDLVEWQLRVAQGEALPVEQGDVSLRGHAIEARLYAEDPADDFRPTTGEIALWRPSGDPAIRTDAGVATGLEIGPWYDALVAKVVAWGETREIARRRLVAGLKDTVLFGPASNKDFLLDCLAHPVFVEGSATTRFVEEARPEAGSPDDHADALAAAAAWYLQDRRSRVAAGPGVARGLLDWSSGLRLPARCLFSAAGRDYDVAIWPEGNDRYRVALDGRERKLVLSSVTADGLVVAVDGRRLRVGCHPSGDGSLWVSVDGRDRRYRRTAPGRARADEAEAGGRVLAAMHGVVQDIFAEAGAVVEAGDRLLVLEAMKMQQDVRAPVAGKVASIRVRPGQQIATGDLLLEIDDA